jgi:uncharacterized protein YceH (UPF0502 family)
LRRCVHQGLTIDFFDRAIIHHPFRQRTPEDLTVPPILTANEARIVGCLMEKSVVTPDQYPLSLNALTNACNQKSSRDPVLSLDPGTVEHTVRELAGKHLVRSEENFKRGIEKYKQRFCNTTFSDYQFDSAEFAIVCLLLLRGPQTPGEFRARSGRLHSFEDNEAVTEALLGLSEREGGPLVVKLTRAPGRKDAQYMHLFFGPIDAAMASESTDVVAPARPLAAGSMSDLQERVSKLEAELADLKAKLNL